MVSTLAQKGAMKSPLAVGKPVGLETLPPRFAADMKPSVLTCGEGASYVNIYGKAGVHVSLLHRQKRPNYHRG